MIQRVVLVRLKPAYRDARSLQSIVRQSRETLPSAHGVRALEIVTPADERTSGEWDLCLLLRFDTIDDVERYRTDRVHRAYADVFLKPMQEKIRVYNFRVME